MLRRFSGIISRASSFARLGSYKSASSPKPDPNPAQPSTEGDASERKAFDESLSIVALSEGDAEVVVELPHKLAEGHVIDAEGHLKAYVNAGLVGLEESFHATLRSSPSVAATVTSLHLVIQGPAEIDLSKRDSTMATQRKGLTEWAKTVPALKNLVKVKVSHLRADEGGVYVPGEDEAEKGAKEDQRGHLDASMLMKALAWYGKKLVLLELESVDMSEDAARTFQGSSSLRCLRLEACPTRVSTLIPRLSNLSEIVVVETGHLSLGCDYVALLSHVKTTLTCVALTLQDRKVDLQEFITSLAGAPLRLVVCPFATSAESPLSPEEIETKLKEAFPTYGVPATATDVPLPTTPKLNGHPKLASGSTEMDLDSNAASTDVEMSGLGVPTVSPNGTRSSPRRTIKRSAIVQARKEELKIADSAAAKDKSKGSVRKARTASASRK